MKLIQIHRGRTEKVVTIDNEGEANPSRLELFKFACNVTGENSSTLFGYHIAVAETPTGEKVSVVSLYTD